MPRLFTRHSPAGMPGSERVFRDERGRLWSAALTERDAPRGALLPCPGSAWQSIVPPDGTLS